MDVADHKDLVFVTLPEGATFIEDSEKNFKYGSVVGNNRDHSGEKPGKATFSLILAKAHKMAVQWEI